MRRADSSVFWVVGGCSLCLHAFQEAWCVQEIYTCPLICLQTSDGAQINTCDAVGFPRILPAIADCSRARTSLTLPRQQTLTYGCLCNNGLQPNMTEYSLTLPFFVCTEWGQQCVADCGSENQCASACTQDHPCGATNPTRTNTTTSSTMSATGGATAQASNQVFTGLGGGSPTAVADAGTSGAGPAVPLGNVFGLGAVAGAVFAGFALTL